MKLESVMQLQTMNEMMKGQFDAYPIFRVMILGLQAEMASCIIQGNA